MVASRFLWQQKQRFRNSSPTNDIRPFSWPHLLDAHVAAGIILTADLLRTVGRCFLGDGCMMRRSPTSSPAPEAAAIGVEVEAPSPSSRWKRLGALGIMLCALQGSASLGASVSSIRLLCLGETVRQMKILQERNENVLRCLSCQVRSYTALVATVQLVGGPTTKSYRPHSSEG